MNYPKTDAFLSIAVRVNALRWPPHFFSPKGSTQFTSMACATNVNELRRRRESPTK
jgi:hypothetical protein